MISPAELEISLNQLEKKVVQRLCLNHRLINSFILILLMYLLYVFKLVFSGLNFKYLQYPNISNSLNTIILLGCLSILVPYLSKGKMPFYNTCVFVVLAFADTYFFSQGSFFVTISFSFVIMAACSYFLMSSELGQKIRYRSWIALIFFVIFLTLIFKKVDGWEWFYLKKPMYYMAFVIAYLATIPILGKRSIIKMLFNPAHLILPINYPIEGEECYGREDYDVWVSGLVQLAKGFMFLMYAFLWLSLVNRQTASLVTITLASYGAYLLLAPSVANFITGCSRLFLVNTPDCSNHLWLSGSPLDFLKRENVHAYVFSIRFFYFNFLKLTRNIFVIVFLYFLIFPLFRGLLTFFTRPTFDSFFSAFNHLRDGYWFWTLLFVSILLTYKCKYFNREIFGWWAVLLNHLVMLLAFASFSFYFRML